MIYPVNLSRRTKVRLKGSDVFSRTQRGVSMLGGFCGDADGRYSVGDVLSAWLWSNKIFKVVQMSDWTVVRF